MDEKTALVDTADASITRQFLENITHTLSGRGLDYLIVTTWSRITAPTSRSCSCATLT